ncbi:Zcf27p [Paraconiothyrium brasiliense]|uniref:Zcf27p n=1 Tax=Paraconiothyrium brasiliense TaxID=300254 RepID=A0ABR3R8T6_9PLEO
MLLLRQEQLVRDVGGPNSSSNEASEPALNEPKLDRSQLLPCSIDDILEWEPLKRLRGGQELSTPAFPCTNRSVTQMTTSPPISGLDEFEPHRIKVLLDNFFNYVHVKNPVLDEQQTRRTVNRVCLHGIDWSPDACLALLVCALGTIATPLDGGYVHRDSEAYRTAESFFLAAKKRLGLVLGTSSLIEAQCMFFATFQSLIAFRQEYGAQLDEAERRSAAAEQAIYWSAWKSEREVNDDLNLPGFLFSEIDIAGYPPFFPTPPSHDGEVLRLVNTETETREQLSWYFYLSEISLLRLWRRMAKEVVQFTPDPRQSHILGLAQRVADRESQIEDWIRALPENMSTLAPAEEDEICRFVLRGHLINVWEIVYWPFVNWAVASGSRTEEAPLIQRMAHKGLEIHVARIHVNRPGFSHRHHGTFGMIKSCTRSALILLAAANSPAFAGREDDDSYDHDNVYHMPPGWREAIEEVIHLLDSWEHESADLSTMAATLRLVFRNSSGIN